MPLEPKHIIKYLNNITVDKNRSELLSLLIKRIDQLCFENCQIDRVACTLTPSCNRRQFLNMRIVSNIEEIPDFCYGIQKNIIQRDFKGKTNVYKPNDSYLHSQDFFDIFFHGDYRKITRFIERGQWDKIYKIFDDRILYQNEDFEYILSENNIIIKYGERLHIVFIKENYVLCNANRESIANLGILSALCELFIKIYFPDVKLRAKRNKYIIIKTLIPQDILSSIVSEKDPEVELTKNDDYFWNLFQEDLEALSRYCKKIKLSFDLNYNLTIKLYVNLRTNHLSNENQYIPLRYRDLRWILNFIYRLYNDFYILWV